MYDGEYCYNWSAPSKWPRPQRYLFPPIYKKCRCVCPSMPPVFDELDSWLFECVDSIQDAVASADYEEYILTVVYYKS